MSDMTPSQIEADLARNREALAQSVAALCNRLAPSTLLAEGKDALKAQALPLMSGIDQAVRARPLTAAAAGVALAALVLGRRQGIAADTGAVSALAGTQFESLTRWEDEGGPASVDPMDADEDWLTDAVGLKVRAADLLHQIDQAARRGLAPAAQLAAMRAEVGKALVRDTARALGHGLETLGGAAHDQALAARERIYLNRLALAGRAEATVAAHPLATGFAVAAAGATVACLFPQTDTEDRLLGDARDSLFNTLRGMLRDEALAASALARTVTAAFRDDLASVSQFVVPVQSARTP